LSSRNGVLILANKDWSGNEKEEHGAKNLSGILREPEDPEL